MDNNVLTKVALRYKAVFLDVNRADINLQSEATASVLALVRRLQENGYCVSEELLHALNNVPVDRLAEITSCINEVMGVNLNWTPLVKGWDVPTGESLADHLITWVANIFGKKAGFKAALCFFDTGENRSLRGDVPGQESGENKQNHDA